MSLRAGFVDSPDQHRKLHAKSVPRVGGIAVFGAYLIAILLVGLAPKAMVDSVWREIPGGWWLAAAVACVFFVGLLDDIIGLQPKQKLMGQLLAAFLAWHGGVQIHILDGFAFGPWLSLILTIAWLVMCANAFNLIDGLDGLATGASLFATLTVLIAAGLAGNRGLVLVSIPLAGALLGFLRYNFNPASIFLGDCGSLTLGFLLGCFGTLWSQKTNTLLGLSAPVMAYSLPLIDICLSIVRRALRSKPIFSGDRGHIHHRLLDKGNSPRRAVILLYGMCALAAVFSLVQQLFHRQLGFLVVAAFCVASWLAVKHLGYLELILARQFLLTGTVFRQIDDQVRLQILESSLSKVCSIDDALDLIQGTCSDLGFDGVSLVTNSGENWELLKPGACQITIPVRGNMAILLNGMSRMARPIALPQLSRIITSYFESASLSEEAVSQEETVLPLLAQAMHG